MIPNSSSFKIGVDLGVRELGHDQRADVLQPLDIRGRDRAIVQGIDCQQPAQRARGDRSVPAHRRRERRGLLAVVSSVQRIVESWPAGDGKPR